MQAVKSFLNAISYSLDVTTTATDLKKEWLELGGIQTSESRVLVTYGLQPKLDEIAEMDLVFTPGMIADSSFKLCCSLTLSGKTWNVYVAVCALASSGDELLTLVDALKRNNVVF